MDLSGVRIVIPHRGLRDGKARLADVLAPDERVTALPTDAPGDDPTPTAPPRGEPPDDIFVIDDEGTAPPFLRAATEAALTDGVSTIVGDESGRQWFVESFRSPPRLVVVGAVHAALPLIRFARELGYRTVVVDRRATFATAERLPDADEVHIAWPEDAFAAIGLGRRDAVAILSHDAKLDEPAIVAALRAGSRYVGAIGSRKTQLDRQQRLLDRGLTRKTSPGSAARSGSTWEAARRKGRPSR